MFVEITYTAYAPYRLQRKLLFATKLKKERIADSALLSGVHPMPSLDDLLQHPTRATKSSRGKGSTLLFLGELGLGTKASDPRALKGLAHYLRANNLTEEIGHVLVNGGMLPYIPTFYGVQNAREMMFLGNDWDREIDEREKLKLENCDTETKEFIEKWVLYKITNMSQAIDNSRRALVPLAESLDNSVWHYLLGEEDNKNTEALIEIKVNEYVATHEQRKRDEKQKERLEFEVDKLNGELSQLEQRYTLLRELRNGVNPNAKKDTATTYIAEFLEKREEDINKLEDPDKFHRLVGKSTKRQHLTDKVNQLDEDLKKQRTEFKQKQRALKDVTHALSAQEREREAAQFHSITKRRHIKPDQAELLRGQAKDEYNSNLYSVLPGSQLHVHSGNEVDLVVDGVHVNFAHSASIRSRSPGLTDVKRTKEKQKQLLREGHSLPDLAVTAHGAGGFRMEAMGKEYESIENYVDRETPEVCMAMQLPTLQDVEKLRVLTHKRIKNAHTERYEKGNYSSGAVFYKVKETGEHEVTMVTTKELLRMADIGDRIVELESYEHPSPEHTSEIEALYEQLKFEPTTGSVFTDIHFGAPNKEGRPTNYEVFEKSAAYVRENGLPDVLVINGDILHGCLERHFGSNEQYYGKGPVELKQEIDALEGTPEAKLEQLEKIIDRAHSQIPITVVSKQLREAKKRLIPLAHKVLENGGHVVFTSGNHYNETSKFLDEATDLVNLLDMKYIDSPQVVAFDGFGDKYGMGQVDLEGVMLYCSHGPTRGSDNVTGGLRQVKGSMREADVAVYGHVHHCGGGHGGDTFVVVGAGMQTWNPYLDRIGMEAGLRGIVNFAYDQDKEVFKWDFVLDPALE